MYICLCIYVYMYMYIYVHIAPSIDVPEVITDLG